MMHDAEEIRQSEDSATKENELPQENEFFQDGEEDSPDRSRSLWRLLPGAIFVLVGLVVITAIVITLDSHHRNVFFGALAALLIFCFGFASLIVRSYNREKQKLGEQNPYRDDHIIK
jgi:uncharacterized membrane protein YcjF (UPF0283 family)